MSAPEVIRESCGEARARLRDMAERARALRAEIARARREGYEAGYRAGLADAARGCAARVPPTAARTPPAEPRQPQVGADGRRPRPAPRAENI